MRIAIIGLGYVGTGVGRRFAEEGHTVVGYDTDPERGRRIEWRVDEYAGDEPTGRTDGPFAIDGSTDPSVIYDAEAVIVAVPTPLDDSGGPDHSHVAAAADLIEKHCPSRGLLIVLESTVSPGATRRMLAERFPGHDVAFSPERIDPGNSRHVFANTAKLVAGATTEERDRAVALYQGVCSSVVPVESLETAEIAKLWENTFRAVNIAMANDIAAYCRAIGVDPFAALDAAATKPFGFMPFRPGPGPGGHCIPVDPAFLLAETRAAGTNAATIEAAQSTNGGEWLRVVQRIEAAVGCLYGKRILIYGVAYKAGVGDTRESPARTIVDCIRDGGGEVFYEDPHVAEYHGTKATTPDDYGAFDAVVILTDHPELDVDRVAKEAKVVVDTRGRIPCASPSTPAR